MDLTSAQRRRADSGFLAGIWRRLGLAANLCHTGDSQSGTPLNAPVATPVTTVRRSGLRRDDQSRARVRERL